MYNITESRKKYFSTLFYFLFSIFYFTSFIYGPTSLPWTSFDSEVYVLWSGFFLFIILLLYKNNKIILSRLSIVLFLLLIYSLLQYKIYSFKQDYIIINCVILFILFLSIISSTLLDNKKNIIYMMVATLVSAAFFNSLISFLQFLNLTENLIFISEAKSKRYSGNLGQPNHMGTLVIIGICGTLFFYNKYKIKLILLLLPLLVVGGALSQSRTMYISLLIIFIFILYYTKKNIVEKVYSYLFFLVILLFSIVNYSLKFFTNNKIDIVKRIHLDSSRFDLYKDFFSTVDKIGLIGNGFSSLEKFIFFNGKYYNYYVGSFHNIFLDTFFYWGVVGLLLLLYIMVCFFNFYIRLSKSSDVLLLLLIIPIFVHSFFEFPLNYAYFILPIVIIYNYFDKYRISLFYISKYFFGFIVVVFFIIFLKYISVFNENRSLYRTYIKGHCGNAKSKEQIIFDRFEKIAIVNCSYNISLKNLELYVKVLSQNPNPRNMRRLIFVYNQLGYEKERDELINFLGYRYKIYIDIREVENFKW